MNALERLSACERELKLAFQTVRTLIRRDDRHGDLIVARGAALRLADLLKDLIDYEEANPAAAPGAWAIDRGPDSEWVKSRALSAVEDLTKSHTDLASAAVGEELAKGATPGETLKAAVARRAKTLFKQHLGAGDTDVTVHGGAPKKPKRAKRETKAASHETDAPNPETPAPKTHAGAPTIAQLLLDQIRKKPFTSAELHLVIDKIRKGTPIGSIYTELSKLKASGAIRGINDEQDGLRKWVLR